MKPAGAPRRKGGDGSWAARLVDEIGRAASGGWGYTARLITLLAVVAGAIALIAHLGR